MDERNDIHRPSTIKPEEYQPRVFYALASSSGGWPVPSVNVDQVIALRQNGAKFADRGGLGKCTICGANFIYGEVWEHMPSHEMIHIGHDCADKYALIADRRAFEADLEGARVRSAREHEKAMKAEKRAGFLADHPGLEAALLVDHYIIADIARRFEAYGDLSPKQVALVMKIAAEKAQPRAEEAHVPAPTGRQVIRGTVVSAKMMESMYGETLKITVKVTTPEGTWLAWGTCPSSLALAQAPEASDEVPNGYAFRGSEVEFTATLSAGREPHFALFKRPTGGTVVQWAKVA